MGRRKFERKLFLPIIGRKGRLGREPFSSKDVTANDQDVSNKLLST